MGINVEEKKLLLDCFKNYTKKFDPNNMYEIPVCIYARKSQTDSHENSIDMQINVCKKFIEDCNTNVLQEEKVKLILNSEKDIFFEDNRSGMFEDREQLEELKKAIKSNKYCACFVLKIDRLARKRTLFDALKELFESHHCMVISTQERDERNASGYLNQNLLCDINEYHARNSASLSAYGTRNKVEKCQVVGLLPFGLKASENKKIIINEDEAPAIRLAFDLAIKGLTLEEIANSINDQGFLTRNGKQFDRKDVTRILRNVKYKGTYLYGDKNRKTSEARKKHKVLIENFDEIRIENAFEAIVDPELFDRVQTILDDKKKTKYYSSGIADYLLSSLIKCNCCKETIIGTRQKKNKYKYHYRVYYCENHRRHLADCDVTAIRVELIEGIIKKSVTKIVNEVIKFHPDYLESSSIKIKKNVSEQMKRERGIHSNQIRLAETLKEKLCYEKNDFLISLYTEKLLELNSKLSEQEQKIKSLEEKIQKINKQIETAKDKSFQVDEEQIFNNKAMGRRLVKCLVKEILYDNDQIIINFNV